MSSHAAHAHDHHHAQHAEKHHFSSHANLKEKAAEVGVAEELFHPWHELDNLRVQLETALEAKKFKDASELVPLQTKLVEFESKHKHDGIWGGDLKAGEIPVGQGVLQDLMEKCHEVEQKIIESLP